MWSFLKRFFGKSVIVPAQTVPSVGATPTPFVVSSTPDILLGRITGASEIEKAMIIHALSYVKAVVYSPAFYTSVMAASFTTTDGCTNEQIYKAFTTQSIVVNVDDYTGSWKANHVSKTMGYENGDGYVHANRVFVYEAIGMASLILHEVAHQLGFRHISPNESTSIPYTMNRIFELINKQQLSIV